MMPSLDADVVVVGAGMAGLACASALRRAGRSVIVMEASFHIGGRIRTVREAALNGAERALPASHGGWMRFHSAANNNRPLGVDNFPFEVGGEFVHGTDTPLNHLLDAEKAELKELFTWAHGDGGPSEHPAHDGGIGMYWIGAEKRLMRFDAQDDDHKQMVAALWSLGERSISELRANEGQSLYDYLKSKGVTERAMKFAENGYANTVGGTLNKISASRMSQCEKNWAKDGDGDFRVGKGGLDEVAVRAMARDLDIRRGVPVSKIVRTPECVVVSSTSKGGVLLRAATVVVAVPIPVLQREMIDFSPALPAAKQTAIKSMDCEPALKVLAKFSARFWPENLHGMVCTDSFAPELWFDTHKWDGHTSYYVTAFFTSDQARAVGNMSTEHAFTALLDQLSLMFKCDSRQLYAGGFIVDWGKVPFIWGGYTTPSMRELPHARAELARPVDGALFFAGEATDPDNFMTAHAAMASGVRAAKEAMVAIDARAAAMKIVSKM